MARSNSTYFPHIDGLRAIAVLSVLFFHLDLELFSGGYVGVDVFFVISGYLITRIIANEITTTNHFDFKSFYVRRIRRLVPAYLTVVMISTAIASLLFAPTLLKDFAASAVSSLLSVSNIYFWLGADYFDTSSHLKPLLHTWSLSIEEQFYLFWPITLLLLFRTSRLILIGTLFTLFFASLCLNLVFADGYVYLLSKHSPVIAKFIENGQSTIFFLLPFRIFEFLCGAILVFLPEVRRTNAINSFLLSGLGLLSIGYGIFFFDSSTVFPAFNALYPCIGTALAIRYGSTGAVGRLLANPAFIGTGLISYSLYLVHWPLVVFYKYLTLEQQLSAFGQISLGFISILFGFLSYKYIEKPFRAPIQGKIIKNGRSFAVVFVVTITLGLFIYTQDGWKWRSNDVQAWPEYLSQTEYSKTEYGGFSFGRFGPLEPMQPAKILLIGDSHALHYASGLEMIRVAHGINTFISAGTSCLHLQNFTRKSNSQNYDLACPRAYRRLVKVIEENPSIKTVILAQRWNLQIPESAVLGEHREITIHSPSMEYIENSILALKQKLGGTKLVLVGQLPETNEINLHDLINRPKLALGYVDIEHQLKHSTLSVQTLENNLFLRSLASKNDGIVFLDPTEKLCSQTTCKNFDSFGKLLYSDVDHLSKDGSKFLIGQFEKELLSLIVEEGPNMNRKAR